MIILPTAGGHGGHALHHYRLLAATEGTPYTTTDYRLPSGKQRRHLPLFEQLLHLRVGWASSKAAAGVKHFRQQVDIARSIEEDTRLPQHPVGRQIDVGLLLERLIPGGRG